MPPTKEDIVPRTLAEFTDELRSALPLGHFTQFYEDAKFNESAQEVLRNILGQFEENPELSLEETLALTPQLIEQMQEVITQWKVKNVENKTKSEEFVQSQVEFLLRNFTTSVEMKVLEVPDVDCEDLKIFVEAKRTALIGVVDILAKLPELQEDMKRNLEVHLKDRGNEAVERLRLELERKAAENAAKVLESAKIIIFEMMRQLKSKLEVYKGKDPKGDLVKETLKEIDYYLNGKGLVLREHHPTIHSAILETTKEVRKRLGGKDFEGMSAEEFEETLHQQLLFDFAGDDHNHNDNDGHMDSNSVSSSDGGNEDLREVGHQKGITSTSSVKPSSIESSEDDEMLKKVNERKELKVEIDVIDEYAEEVGEDEYEMGLDQQGNDSTISSAVVDVDVERRDNVEDTNADGFQGNSEIMAEDKPDEIEDVGFNKTVTMTTANASSKHSSVEKPHSSNHLLERRRTRSSRNQLKKVLSPEIHSEKRSVTKPKPVGRGFSIRVTRCDRSAMATASTPELPHPSKSNHHLIDRKRTRSGRGTQVKKSSSGKDKTKSVQRKSDRIRHRLLRKSVSTSGSSPKRQRQVSSAVKTRTGEKPFKCNKCPERFSNRSNLQTHARRHDRGSHYHCRSCNISFVSSHRLHDHNWLKHKEEKLPFACCYCHYRFKEMGELRAHVIIHADLQPFQCPTCKTSVADKRSLWRHIQQLHSVSEEAAKKLANEAVRNYLVRESKDESYRDIPDRQITSIVAAYVIKKAKLKLPGKPKRKST